MNYAQGTSWASAYVAGAAVLIKQINPNISPDQVDQILMDNAREKGAEVIEGLDTETAAETIAEAEPETQVSIMQQLDDQTASDIITEMEPDDAADLVPPRILSSSAVSKPLIPGILTSSRMTATSWFKR